MPATGELIGRLKERLPDYMVPAVFATLDALPLTPNGKVDRPALPEPDLARPELRSPYVAPRDELERTVAGIWRELLGVEQVGVDDNFFELGGHSLLMARGPPAARRGGRPGRDARRAVPVPDRRRARRLPQPARRGRRRPGRRPGTGGHPPAVTESTSPPLVGRAGMNGR